MPEEYPDDVLTPADGLCVLGVYGGDNPVDEDRSAAEQDYLVGHSANAAVVRGAAIQAACAQERFDRIKHSNKVPMRAVRACLEAAGLSFTDVDLVALPVLESSLDAMLDDRYETSEDWTRRWGRWRARAFVQRLIAAEFGISFPAARLRFVHHHQAHAALAYYTSGYGEALVVTIDGVGDNVSLQVSRAAGARWEVLRSCDSDHSLGYLYDWMTDHLGFSFFDEYKVMGMAAYGDASRFRARFNELAPLQPEGYFAIDWGKVWNARRLIPRRRRGELPLQIHMDFAAAVQELFERLVFHVTAYFRRATGLQRLCVAGGCALNCLMNGKLLQSGLFEDVHVPPAAGDEGLSLGAALHISAQTSPPPLRRMPHAFLGAPVGSAASVAADLDAWSALVDIREAGDIASVAARLLADGALIGWVQGTSEYGDRALGNRSILADPRPPENRTAINAKIKGREEFRPLAPAVLEEFVGSCFDLPSSRTDYSFMAFTLPVRGEWRSRLAAATHADGSARVQTVRRDQNPRFWELIWRFYEVTGVPAVLNTSFNNASEPIVESVADALTCFLTCDLDCLIVDRFVVTKKPLGAGKWPELLCLSRPEFVKLRETSSGGVDERDAEASLARPVSQSAAKRYELGTSFRRDFRLEVSEHMFRLLLCADGHATVNALIRDTLPASIHAAAVVDELSRLWTRRLVRLLPPAAAAVSIRRLPARETPRDDRMRQDEAIR